MVVAGVHEKLHGYRKSSIVSALRPALILIIFLLLLTPCAVARDYSLDSATANVTVSPEGIVHIEETISYSFQGTYSEVYRRVYPPEGGSIKNISGYCDYGKYTDYNSFRTETVSGGYELIGSLPSPTPEKVTFVVSYDYYGGLKVYNDVSELHFKMWGDEWEKPVGRFTATINLPVENNDEISYWIHPEDYTSRDYTQGDSLIIESDNIPSGRWYELRAVFPRIESPDPDYVSIQNQDGLEEIKAAEYTYQLKRNAAKFVFVPLGIIAILTIVFPFIIYFRYGREPEIDYYALYEREPPTDSKPAYVNAMLRGRIGTPTIEGFTATVMDLVNRGYIDLKDVRIEKKFIGLFSHEKEDVILEIKEKTGTTYLLDFEDDVYELLKKHASSGTVLWSELRKELGKNTEFYTFISKWNQKVEDHIKLDRMFLSKGNTYMAVFSIVIIFAMVFGLIFITNVFPLNQFPFMIYAFFIAIPVLLISVIMIITVAANEQGFGKWTPEGRLYRKRWMNFREYLTDYSVLKDHPPESVRIWDFYMVYAIAMGVAEKALKNMSLTVSEEEIGHSHFYPIHYSPMLTDGFRSAYSASAPDSSSHGGGIGGAGGGFGGGGGGAR